MGDGLIQFKYQLRRVAQLYLVANLAAQPACRGLQALHHVLGLLLAAEYGNIALRITQIVGNITVYHGNHSLLHTRVLDRAHRLRQSLHHFFGNTINSSRHFTNQTSFVRIG